MRDIKINEVRKIKRGSEYFPSFHILDDDGHIDKSIAFASQIFPLEFLDKLEGGNVITSATYDPANTRAARAFISYAKLTAEQTRLFIVDEIFCYLTVEISSGIETVKVIKFEVYG